MAKTFTLCFEGDTHTPKFELELPWDGERTPEVIEVGPWPAREGDFPRAACTGMVLVKVGRYASPGDRYWYRRAEMGRVVGDALEAVPNSFAPNERIAKARLALEDVRYWLVVHGKADNDDGEMEAIANIDTIVTKALEELSE
jgi:hypothetical protein